MLCVQGKWGDAVRKLRGEKNAALDDLLKLRSGVGEDDLSLANVSVFLESIKTRLALESLIVDGEDDRSIDVLSTQHLPKSEAGLDLAFDLIDNITAMLCASEYRPTQIALGSNLKLTVHNSQVAEKLKPKYSHKEFSSLAHWLNESGVFSLMVDSASGLVKTSAAEENWEMSGRQWITDTCRCGDLQRVTHPSSWPKALLLLANFYNQPLEKDAFTQSIKDASWYRDGALDQGVAHVFIPETFLRDPHYNNSKRLESQGLALKAFCDTLIAGLIDGSSWGFSGVFLQENSNNVLITDAIAHLASYIRSININPVTGEIDFNAPSCGNWEEIPFPGGLTWDIEAMRQGLVSFHRLMFGDFPETMGSASYLSGLRRQIASHKHAAWMSSEQALLALIEAARQKVIYRIVRSERPCESPLRESDSSLAFISACNTKLADDELENVRLHFRLLQSLEDTIVREHGILRYAPFDMLDASGTSHRVFDNYLADNYWLIPGLRAALRGRASGFSSKGFKSLDCSTEDKFIERGSLAREGLEAEWCWVSAMSEGYSTQVIALDRAIRSKQVNRHEAEKLMKVGASKATEYMNRALARITGEGVFKSNGKACPVFSIPEAYEYVSSLENPGTLVALPGAHTPLSWAVASLHNACDKLSETISLVTD